MGNELLAPVTSKYVLNKRNLSMLEQQVLEITQMDKQWFLNIDVPVGEFNSEKVFIRTLIVYEEIYNLRMGINRNVPPRETLVILHGYGGAGVLFFPVM
jgi:hypothetical protein